MSDKIRVELEFEDGTFTRRVVNAAQKIEHLEKTISDLSGNLNKVSSAADGAANAISRYSRNAASGVSSIRSLDQRTKSFLGTMRDVSIVVGAFSLAFNKLQNVGGTWVGSLVKTNAEFERMNILMQSLSSASDPIKDASDNVDRLRQSAKQTPFSLHAISDAFVKMKATGIDPLDGSLRAFTDAVAAAGGNDEMLKRVSIAISQMSGKGVIQMEELRQQLGEAIPRATELMARSMGVTYSELISALATGRVEAKASLAGLRDELLRTFGGSGQRMMDTFNGMVSKTKTVLQELALEAGGEGFFVGLKQQLSDLNSFLQSDFAGNLAREFGAGLNSIAGYIRSTIDVLIRFRYEIGAVAQALAVAFGARVALSGITALITGMGTLVTNARNLGAALGAIKAGGGLAAAATALQGITVAAPGVAAAGVAATGFAGGLAAIGTAAGLAIPIVGAFGVAIVAVANYFDLFSTKSQKAYDDIKRLGAVTVEQVQGIKPLMDAKRAELAALVDEMHTWENKLANSTSMTRSERQQKVNELRESVNKLNAELLDMNTTFDKAMDQAESVEAGAAVSREMIAVRSAIAEIKVQYDIEARARTDRYKDAIAEAVEHNRDQKDITDTYHRELIAIRDKYSDDLLSKLKRLMDAEQEIYQKAAGKEKQIAVQKYLELKALYEQEADLKKRNNVVDGVPILAKAPEISDELDKANTIYDRLAAKAAEYRGDLLGINGEVQKFVYQLTQANGAAPLDNKAMQESIEKLVAQQEEVTKLKEMIDGRTKFQRELDSLQETAEEEYFKQRYGNLSKLDQLKKKVELGYYKGVTKSDQERMLEGMSEALRKTGQTSTWAMNTLKEGFYSEGMAGRANTMLDILNKTVKAFAAMKSIITGISLDEIANGLGSFSGFAGSDFSGQFGGIFGNKGVAKISGPIQATELPPEAQALLRVIGGMEGGGYNVMYGGGTFGSFADHPRIGNLIKSGRNAGKTSTASGMYQFIESTWDMLQKELGLTDFSPANQDRAAWHLAVKDYGSRMPGRDLLEDLRSGNMESIIKGLGGSGDNTTWEALQGVNPDKLMAGLKKAAADVQGSSSTVFGPLVEIPQDLLEPFQKQMEYVEKLTSETTKLTGDNKLAATTEDLIKKWSTATEKVDGYGKMETAVRRSIQDGDFGLDADLQSKRYAEVLDWAKKVDEQEKNITEQKQLQSELDNAAKDTAKTKAEYANEMRRLQNVGKSGYQPSDEYVRREQEWDTRIETIRSKLGEESGLYKQALANRETDLRAFKNREIAIAVNTAAQKAEQDRLSTMTESQQRQYTLQQTISYYQSLLANFQGNADERLEIERKLQAAILQLRQQSSVSGPLGRQMQQWSDFGANMEQAMTGWLDSGIDAIANFVATGKADFKSLAQSIIKDFTKLALKWAVSKMFGFGGGNNGGKGAKGLAANAATGGKGGASKLGGLFGMAHTGGVIGSSGLASKHVSAAAFMGAPRFHTGGLIKGMGLGPDEVPIIAKKGEGVFTPEQMAAMGNMGGQVNNQAVTVSTNVNVNATGGSKEANADLAKQIGREVEGSVRAMVVKELMVQRRPGGLIGAK